MSAEQQTPARDRLVESAARILENLGGRRRFRRVTATKDPRRQSQSFAVVGDPVGAVRSNLFTQERRRQAGERQRVERIAVERAPFEPAGLSDLWEVELATGWTPLANVALSEDRTTWEADLAPLGEMPS